MTDFINVSELPEEEVKFVQRIVYLLRETKGKGLESHEQLESGLELSAGSWKELLDPEKLKESITRIDTDNENTFLLLE